MESFDHFDRLIHESNRKLFYVSSHGYAYSIDKKTKERTTFKNTLHGGQVRICIHNLKTQNLKQLVYFEVTGKVLDGNKWNIMPIDGDETNCSFENLKVVPRSEISRRTGAMSRSRKVMVQEYRKEPVTYSSVREAAKALYCSYQTLLDYLSGASGKRSALRKWGRKIRYVD